MIKSSVFSRSFMAIGITFLCFTAHAATTTSKPLTESQIRAMAMGAYQPTTAQNANDAMINVQVPQSSLTFKMDHKLFRKNRDTLEATVSGWVPKGYSNASAVQNTTNYNVVDVPQASFNFMTSGYTFSSLRLRPKYGFSYAQFARTGTLPVNNGNLQLTEHLNFYSVRFGYELTTQNSYYRFKPVVSLALLPSWQQAETSPFTNGISTTSMLYEASVGASLKVLANAGLGFHSVAVESGLERAQAFGNKTLAATAVYAGLRATL